MKESKGDKTGKRMKGNEGDKTRNKILELKEFPIPYVKELRQLPGAKKSVTACILIQQLDYWFEKEKFHNGFYKFLEPCEGQRAYQKGDSWTEELNFSAAEFKTAFNQIGVSYKSKKDYNAAPDKFQGKYYCSYFNKVTRQTYYFRNHELIDNHLEALFRGNGESHSLETNVINSVESGIPELVEFEVVEPEYTETTSKITPNKERENFANANSHIINYQEDKEDEVNNICSPSGTPHSRQIDRKLVRAVVLPDDFALNRDMRFWASKETYDVAVEEATEKFIDYYRSNLKKSADWVAEWRNWMRRELDYESRRVRDEKYSTNRYGDSDCAIYDICDAMEEYVKNSDFPVTKDELRQAFSDLSDKTFEYVLSDKSFYCSVGFVDGIAYHSFEFDDVVLDDVGTSV